MTGICLINNSGGWDMSLLTSPIYHNMLAIYHRNLGMRDFEFLTFFGAFNLKCVAGFVELETCDTPFRL